MLLDASFYSRANVVVVAKDLLGKVLFTRINRKLTGGIIVETEAYSSIERGSHAYGNRRTSRTSVMYEKGGCAYVYLCYGIHHLFNVVTNDVDHADAVLIRALEPLEGLEHMQRRLKTKKWKRITSGPGKLSKALGIDRKLNGESLLSKYIWLEDLGNRIARNNIEGSPRVGIDYAGDDALRPWRFTIKKNSWLSR